MKTSRKTDSGIINRIFSLPEYAYCSNDSIMSVLVVDENIHED
jgi:hypothetical protein